MHSGNAGDFLPAFIGLVGAGDDLRTAHAGRAPLLPEPAAVGPNVARGKVVDHFGKQARDTDCKLAMAAVEMRAFLFFATRG